MSAQEIVEKGRYLVEMLELLRNFASDLTRDTGREFEPQLLSNYISQIGLVLDEISNIRDRLRKCEIEAHDREAALDRREQEVLDLRSRVDSLTLEKTNADSAVQKLEDQRDAGERDRTTLMSSLQSALDKVASVVSRELELARREQAAEDALRENAELVASNTAAQARLERELQARQDADAALMRDQSALERDRTDLEEARRQLEQAKTKLEEDQGHLEQAMAKLEEDQGHLDQDQTKLKEDRSQLDQDRADLKNSLDSVDEDTSVLRDSLERVKGQKDAAETLRAEIDKEKRLSETAKAEADSLKAEAASLKAEAASLKAEADSLKAEADSNLLDAQSKKSAAESLHREAESQSALLRERHETLSSLLVNARNVEAQVGRNLDAVASSLRTAQNLAARLEEDRSQAAEDAGEGRAHLDEIIKGVKDIQCKESENLASSARLADQAGDVLKLSEESVRERVRSAEKSRDAFKAQAATLDQDVKASRRTNTIDRDNFHVRVRNFQQTVDSLTRSRNEAQQTANRMTAELQSQMDSLVNLRRDRHDLELKVRRAEEAEDQTQERVRSLAVEAEASKNQLADAKERYETRHRQDVDSVTRANERLRTDEEARQELEERLAQAEQELQESREACKRLRTERGNRELESRQSNQAKLQSPRAEAPAMSHWEETVSSMLKYVETLKPVSSGSSGDGFVVADDERLMRALCNFMSRQTKRDRFTAFLEARDKPDKWYCMQQICTSRHDGARPLEGRCPLHREHNDCPLQVRHLDASSGGKTLDFRAPIPDEGEDEDNEEGGVKLAPDTC